MLGSLAQNACKNKKCLLVLAHASIHKGKEIEEVAACYITRIFYFPTYSPDFNRIGKTWSVLIRQINAQKDKSIDEAAKSIATWTSILI